MDREPIHFGCNSTASTSSMARPRSTVLAPLRFMWRQFQAARTALHRLVKRSDSKRNRRKNLAALASTFLNESTSSSASLVQFREDANDSRLSFPLALSCPSKSYNQRLITVGHRLWGGGPLRVKLYDFAIYMDPAQVCQHFHSNPLRPGELHSLDGVCRRLSLLADANMSIVLRASRNLPVSLIMDEFGRILQRRTEKVGGEANDPALPEFLQSFPRGSQLVEGGSASTAIRKGTTIIFSRLGEGTLTSEVQGQVVATVNSGKLCEALFDLYLGQDPVCERARDAAEANLRQIALVKEPSEGRGFPVGATVMATPELEAPLFAIE